jgi:hypothetical protein
VESNLSAERVVRNEGEAHPMSPENANLHGAEFLQFERRLPGPQTSKPDEQIGKARNDQHCGHRHGGVGGRGMQAMVVGVKR